MATHSPSKSPAILRALPGHRLQIERDAPLRLDCGASLAPAVLAYQTYGELNAGKSNAILVFHALTGDQFAAEDHPVTERPGWWEVMIGPGRPLDTRRYFIICINVPRSEERRVGEERRC